MKNQSLKSGYSIIEIIIYVSVFSVLVIVVMNAFIVLTSFFGQTRTNHELLESGNTAMERISREIRTANNVRTGSSTLGSSPGVLDLDSVDTSNNAQTVKFSSSNGTLDLYINNTNQGNLLSSNIHVTSLIFRKITTTNSTAVKTEMTLQDMRDKNNLSAKFYDTIILRGGY